MQQTICVCMYVCVSGRVKHSLVAVHLDQTRVLFVTLYVCVVALPCGSEYVRCTYVRYVGVVCVSNTKQYKF